MKIGTAGLVMVFFPVLVWCQVELEWNTYLDLELTKAGSASHYFFNEIHRNYTDWKLDVSQANVVTKLKFSEHWHLNFHLMWRREIGRKAGLFKELGRYKFRMPQLNLQWLSKDHQNSLALGRFVIPFGLYYQQQLFADRTFVNSPLAYSYYINISNHIGLVEGLGDRTRLVVAGRPRWGAPYMYSLGYRTGLKWEHGQEGATTWTLAVVNGSGNLYSEDTVDPLQYGLVGRIIFQPAYFVKFGFSISHATFLNRSEYSVLLGRLRRYRQSLFGAHYKLGKGHFEASGELLLAAYKVPHFLPDEDSFLRIDGKLERRLLSYSGYFDWKYEPPFLPGCFFAYRLEFLTFGNVEDNTGASAAWDNNVWRHVLAIGYKITEFASLKGSISTQSTATYQWENDQRTLRVMLSLFF